MCGCVLLTDDEEVGPLPGIKREGGGVNAVREGRGGGRPGREGKAREGGEGGGKASVTL